MSLTTEQSEKYAVVNRSDKRVLVRTVTLVEAFKQQDKIARDRPKLQTAVGKIMKDGSIYLLEDDNQ